MLSNQDLQNELIERDHELLRLIKETDGAVKMNPERLRISTVAGRSYYYVRPAGAKRSDERCCGSKPTQYIKELAQIDYEKKINKEARRQHSHIQNILPYFEKDGIITLYTQMSPNRRALINPVSVDDETYAKAWLAVEYPQKPFEEGAPLFYSDRGEKVRSKSEKIIADYYFRQGIPYRYEYPVTLQDGSRIRTFHPDFMLLNKRTRHIYYHEHFGRMTDPDYCDTSLWKMEIYEKNGLYPGDSLLITHETPNRPLDMKLLDKLIRRFLT